MAGLFGSILSSLSMAANESFRRNGADNGWEAFTPAAGISLLDVYPVGSIYISISATDPGTLFGGTWAAFGAGRVLVGLDSDDAAFDTAEETGGAKTVASSAQTFAGDALGTHQHAATSGGTPAGTNTAPAFTGEASTVIVNHVHPMNGPTGASGGTITIANDTNASGSSASGLNTANPTGGSASYTPAGSVAAPVFTGNALANHQHDAITAGTPAGTNTPGAATSVVQPYIVVHMFKRTA